MIRIIGTFSSRLGEEVRDVCSRARSVAFCLLHESAPPSQELHVPLDAWRGRPFSDLKRHVEAERDFAAARQVAGSSTSRVDIKVVSHENHV